MLCKFMICVTMSANGVLILILREPEFTGEEVMRQHIPMSVLIQ